MKLLFICNQGQHRSPTAAELFSDKHETRYAGCFSEDHPVTRELILWADTIYVMEQQQRTWFVTNYPEFSLKKRVLTLDIPDIYKRGDERLKKLLPLLVK